MPAIEAEAPPRRTAWSVAALLGAVAQTLDFEFAACTVQGEIAGLSRAASGHCYFSLKDPATGATLRCAMFRRAVALLELEPVDGQRVEVRGRVAVYEARGELQFIVEAMRPLGSGALYERFLRLRARLEAEGLFAAAAKRPLPPSPQRVGVITSLQGAALHDVVSTLARRSPHVAVVLYPSLVQGPDAPDALCRAIAGAAARGEVDVLIVCRGGGALEDLWAFNSERVARAIRAAALPVITGVGHETDVTLADLAADLRAPTPTAAAEMVAPATVVSMTGLDRLASALVRRTRAALDARAQRLDHVGSRLARPSDRLRAGHGRLALLAERLQVSPARRLEATRARATAMAARLRQAAAMAQLRSASRLDRLATRLHGLDPERILERGYAMLTDDAGKAIVSATQLRVGVPVRARLHDGDAALLPTAIQLRVPA